MAQYGSVDQVIARTAATADTLGFSTDQELRDFITTNLEEASSEIDQFCNRTFGLVQNETESKFGNGTETIQLEHGPVESINTVEEDGETLTLDTDFEIKDRSSFSGANSGILRRLEDGEASYVERWWDHQRYHFDYDWGYPDGEWPAVLDNVANEMVIKSSQ